MARGSTNRLYRNFNKGLITEASLLTYPENACTDLDNCILYRKGNISRRLGMNIEAGWATNSQITDPNILQQSAINTYKWEAVRNDVASNFLVQQIGLSVYFYDLSVSPLSAGLYPVVINLASYLGPNPDPTLATRSDVSFSSGKGLLFIVGEYIEPIVVEYLPDVGTLVSQRVYIQVRDFDGVDDSLAIDEESTVLSDAHHYNLLNQGWVDAGNPGGGPLVSFFNQIGTQSTKNDPPETPITAYHTAIGRYPGNNKQWWPARDSTTNAFDPALLNTIFFSSSRAPRGRFVLDAFYKDRSSFSGVPNILPEVNNSRPNSCTFFSGRTWFLQGSTVYFSQVMTTKHKAGMCYQEADPTSEQYSELVATDGGVLPIPEMGKGLKLLAAAGGVLVFANNGVWFISGAGGPFSADNISVQKVSAIGTSSPGSIVETKSGIYWFADVGIQGLQVETGASGTSFNLVTLSEDTIQGFYVDDIPESAKPYVRGIYDKATNIIQWLFNDQDDYRYFYNRILNLDLGLGAFFPFTIADGAPRLCGVFTTTSLNRINDPFNTTIKDTFIKYVFAVLQDGNYYYGFCSLDDYTFVDWKGYDGVGVSYLSYLEAGYELLDDAMRKKGMSYIFTYFRRTEENYIELDGDYTTDNPSSCLLQVKWDWANHPSAGKWSTKFEAYRHGRLPQFDEEDLTFETGYPIVISKNKVRGNGRAIQFRFESNGPGKDFDLLGWSVPYTGNANP